MTSALEMMLEALCELQLVEGSRLREVHAAESAASGCAEQFLHELRDRALLTSWQIEQLRKQQFDELRLGRYVLLEPLGEGGMGRVYRARHGLMNRIVAVKVIHEQALGHPQAVARFRREIELAARLQHRHVVAAYDAEEVDGRLLLVMEYVPGEDLARIVRGNGPLPLSLACEYHRQAALALGHAHEHGLVHRDVKPGNFLVHERHLKVLDLGLAHLELEASEQELDSRDDRLTSEQVLLGTVDFIAPEQAVNARSADARSDIYSLGCSLFFTLTGRVPYPGGSALEKALRHRVEPPPSLARLLPGVPQGVVDLVARMMAKDPNDRFQTAAEVADALAPFAARMHSTPSCDPELLLPSGVGEPTLSAPPHPFTGGERPNAGPAFPPAALVGQPPGSSESNLHSTDPTESHRRLSRRWLCGIGAVLLCLGCWGIYRLAVRPTKSSGPSPDENPINGWATKGRPVDGSVIRRLEHVDTFSTYSAAQPENPAYVMQLLFTLDGQIVLAGGGVYDGPRFGPGRIVRWDVVLGKRLPDLAGFDAPVRAMALSHDGTLLAAAEGPLNNEPDIPGKVVLWDTRTWTKQGEFIGQPGGVLALAFTAEGQLVVAGKGPILQWFDTTQAKPEPVARLDTKLPMLDSFVLSRDGRYLVTGHPNRTIQLWDAKARRLLGPLPAQEGRGWVTGLDFTRDGTRLVAVTNHYGIEVECPPPEMIQWDVASRTLLWSTTPPDGWNFFAVRYTPDGSAIITTGADGASLWDAGTGERLSRFHAIDNFVFALGVSEDGRLVATADTSRQFELWRSKPE